MFYTVYSDDKGNIFESKKYLPVGRAGNRFVEIQEQDLIELPSGAELMMLPGRHPVGISRKDGRFSLVEDGRNVFAVGAVLPQGYTRTLLPAYTSNKGKRGKPLPLFGYTAVAFKGDRFYIAAKKTDETDRWDPKWFNTPELPDLINQKCDKFPENRILKQLARCALDYGCFTAQNIFYERWEGGIPVSPTCNAACLGCISKQPAECCPSPQARINFIPSIKEVVELGVSHLLNAEQPIISFGQGCEGEPTMAGDLLVAAVLKIREKVAKGVININTNGSRTGVINKLCEAGLNSMRVSIISADEGIYNIYYNPKGYQLKNVKQSIITAKDKGVFVSLNLLTFPGVTDREDQVEALLRFLRETGVDMVQFRNLNIDPEFFVNALPPSGNEIFGINNLIKILRHELPHLRIGNCTPYLLS